MPDLGSWIRSEQRIEANLWSAVASAARHRFGSRPGQTDLRIHPKRRRRFALPAHSTAPHLAPLPPVSAAAPGKPVVTPPTHWPTVLFATARALIFVIALPLAMIQLWVDVGKQNLPTFFRSGPRVVLKSLGQTLSRAFAPESVFIYSLGLIVFALIPYVLLFFR